MQLLCVLYLKKQTPKVELRNPIMFALELLRLIRATKPRDHAHPGPAGRRGHLRWPRASIDGSLLLCVSSYTGPRTPWPGALLHAQPLPGKGCSFRGTRPLRGSVPAGGAREHLSHDSPRQRRPKGCWHLPLRSPGAGIHGGHTGPTVALPCPSIPQAEHSRSLSSSATELGSGRSASPPTGMVDAPCGTWQKLPRPGAQPYAPSKRRCGL